MAAYGLSCTAVEASVQPYNRALGLLRVVSIYLLVAALVVVARPTPLSVSVGFLFVAAGQAVRLWAAGHLRKSVELITSGPYRYTRNPIYLGLLALYFGVAVLAGNAWIAALGMPLFAVLRYGVVAREEAYLARRFGADYRRYRARVRRWV